MTLMPSDVRDALRSNPHLTVNLLASQLGSTVDEVQTVLDEYEVLGDGTVQHNGPGQGGGWVTQMTTEGSEGQHAGYRWLDGSMHEEPDPEILRAIAEHQSQVEADE